jgi:Ala-tRNA(Pro) deacylase
MHEVIDLVPGGVSLFGILNDKDHILSIYIDEDMMKEHDIITFLPNVNTATVFIKKEDMLKFIESEGYEYEILNM